jgi:hypothetical protein
MAQKTAVDWLFEQIPVEWTSTRYAYDAYKQAKQMQKQQIKDAYNQAYREVEEDCCKEVGPDIANFANAEDYYNETFGK